MSRNYSIRHFIHHSDSEKVSYDNKDMVGEEEIKLKISLD